MRSERFLFGVTLTFSIVLEFCVRYFDLWHTLWGHMDSLMHFWWGLNVFLILVLFLKFEPRDALLGVFVFQMIWEAIEIVGDRLIPQVAAMLDPFYFDGIKDTVFDLAGAALAWGVLAQLNVTSSLPTSKKIRHWMLLFTYCMLPGIAIGAILSVKYGESANTFALVWIIAAAALAAIITKFRRT